MGDVQVTSERQTAHDAQPLPALTLAEAKDAGGSDGVTWPRVRRTARSACT